MNGGTSTVKPTLVLTVGQAVGFVVTFFFPVLLARAFAPADFGSYKQLFLVHGTLVAVLQLGLAQSLFYFVPTRREATGRYVANAVLVLGLVGLLAGAGLATAGGPLAAAFGNADLDRQGVHLGIFLMLTLMATVLEIAMVALGRFAAAAVTYASSDVLRGLCLVLPVVLFGSVDALMLGAVGFALLRLTGTLVYAARTLPGGLRGDAVLLREQLAYALPFGLAVVMEVLQRNLHHYAVSFQFDPATFAIYAIGSLHIPIIDAVWASAASVLMVRLAALRESTQRKAAVDVWYAMTRRMAILTLGTVAFLEVVAFDLIVVLFTPMYAASVPILRISCLALLAATFMTDSVLRVHAQTRFLMAVNTLRVVAVVGGLLVFLPTLHLLGAALAPVVAVVVGKVVSLARMRQLLGVGWRGLAPWGALAGVGIAAAGAGILTHTAVASLPWPPLARLLAAAPVFALVYGLGVLAVLPGGDRRALLAALDRPRRILSPLRMRGPRAVSG
jgi:O-antigen/teichoic acid export membrane protein